MPYVPPLNTNLPFSFTRKGYSPIDVTAIDFRFVSSTLTSILSATINSQPLYINEAYTYIKQCKKVAIGFENGLVQFLSLPCLYGGLRDFPSFLRSHQADYKDFSANAFVFQTQPADLMVFINGQYDFDHIRDVTAYITTRFPENLSSEISGHYYNNISSSIESHLYKDLSTALYGWTTSEIQSYIKMVMPSDISANVSLDIPIDINSNIALDVPLNLYGTIGVENPSDLFVAMHGWQNSYIGSTIATDLPINITAKVTLDIPLNLYGSIITDLPSNLYGSIGVVPPEELFGSIHGWEERYITALIRIHAGGPQNLTAVIQQDFPRDLLSIISSEFPTDLNIIVGGHLPGNLDSIIHGWQFDYLQSFIAIDFPYNITAEILIDSPKDIGGFLGALYPQNLMAYIGTHFWKDLVAPISGWQEFNLGLNINSHLYNDILVYANVFQRASVNFPSEISTDFPLNLPTTIGTHSHIDLGVNTHGWQLAYLTSAIIYDIPRDIAGSIKITNPYDLIAAIGTQSPLSLYGTIHGWDTFNLSAIAFTGYPFDLSSIIAFDLPRDILAYANVFIRDESTFPSIIDGVLPVDLSTWVGGHLYGNLTSYTHGWDEYYISAGVGMHLPYNINALIQMDRPRDLIGYIKPFQVAIKDINILIHGWQAYSLPTSICTALPLDILCYINIFQKEYKTISGDLYGWQLFDLTANIKHCFDRDLFSTVNSELPINLLANIKAWSSTDFSVSIRSWDLSSFSAFLHPIYTRGLSSYLLPIPPMDLGARMRVTSFGDYFITSYIRAFQYKDLNAFTYALYISNLSSYLFPIVSYNIRAHLRGYDERFLSGYLLGVAYPYNITASIIGAGDFSDVTAYIRAYQALLVTENLPGILSGFQVYNLYADILPVGGFDLHAYIGISSYSSNLQAVLVPKVVRLSKIVGIMTLEKYDLSAMINTSCFGSEIRTLGGFISPIYLYPLSAVLNGVVICKESSNLTATIGMDSRVIMVDRLPLLVKNAPPSIRVIDILPFSVRLYNYSIYNLLSTIVGIPKASNLTASIKSVHLEDYKVIKDVSKALVYDLKKTAGRAEIDKIVEISFRNYVRDYIYLQEANIAFSYYKGDKWDADIISYLPANTTLGLKRRFYKAASLFNLTSYNSIDEAVRDAIVQITEVPFNNLSASVNLYFNTLSKNLSAKVTVLSTHSGNTDLASAIVGASPPLLFSKTGSENSFISFI